MISQIKTTKFDKERKLIQECLDYIDKNFLTKEKFESANKRVKIKKDIVTDIDFEVERFLIEKINENFPCDTILSEEFNPTQKIENRTWVIDPIDGTINFSRGSLIFGCQIALIIDKKPVLSFVHIKNMGLDFIAIEGEGAYLNGKRVFAKSQVPIDEAVVSLGSFSTKDFELADYEFDLLKLVQKNIMSIRLFGAACYDTISVVLGHTNSHIMFAKNLWDVLPGYLIAKEAGCVITKVNGDEVELGFPSYHISANKEITNLVATCAKSLPQSKKFC